VNEGRVIFATVVIFGTGVITGGLLVNHVERNASPAAAQHKSAGGTNGANATAATNGNTMLHVAEILSKPAFLNNLEARLAREKLPLTPAQHEDIEKKISEGQGEMRQLVQDVNANIRELMTPEQRKKYEEMFKPAHLGALRHNPAPTNSPPAAPVVPINHPPAVTNGPV